jgi:hypothetical protein
MQSEFLSWFYFPLLAAGAGCLAGGVACVLLPRPVTKGAGSASGAIAQAANALIALPVSLYLAAFMPFRCKIFDERYAAFQVPCVWLTWVMPCFAIVGLLLAWKLFKLRRRALGFTAAATWIWYVLMVVALRDALPS